MLVDTQVAQAPKHSLPVRSLLFIGCVLGLAGPTVLLYQHYRIRPLGAAVLHVPTVQLQPNGDVVIRHSGPFICTVATFRDELFAYLMYQHFRTLHSLSGDELLLHYNDGNRQLKYEVVLVLTSDFVSVIRRVAELHANGRLERFEWKLLSPRTLDAYRNQTRLFVAAYNLPVKRKLEDLTKSELRDLLRRFIRFKSTTDPRVRKRIEPVPAILSSGHAQRLAGNIIAVAEFYKLPLEFLLGIGAMENNYMNVRGDLEHSIWKRRPAKDDIVLERRRGRVRVLNDSAGVWQITRETLRQVHRLYLADNRDYTQLPEHLRPPKQLDIDNVDPDVLTTYAGLLLRNLLDHFGGDVSLAVGAYNGGPGNPNMRYEQGVRAAAQHARSILERAAVLNRASVLSTSWLTSR